MVAKCPDALLASFLISFGPGCWERLGGEAGGDSEADRAGPGVSLGRQEGWGQGLFSNSLSDHKLPWSLVTPAPPADKARCFHKELWAGDGQGALMVLWASRNRHDWGRGDPMSLGDHRPVPEIPSTKTRPPRPGHLPEPGGGWAPSVPVNPYCHGADTTAAVRVILGMGVSWGGKQAFLTPGL